MKANTIIFFLILQSAGIAVGQNQEARDILLLSVQKLKENNLFQYEASYRIKYFDNTDTSAFTHYNCTVLKMPADTVLGYYARIYNEAEDRVYDGNNFLLVWHEGKKIIRDQPRLSGKKFARDNIRRDNVPHFFYSETPFQSYLSDAKNITLSEEMLDGKKVWKVDVFFPTDEEITFLKRVVYIDRQSYLPLKVEGFAKFQDIQDEYSELILKNVRATVHAGDDFSSFYPYPADYAEEMVQTKNQLRPAPHRRFRLFLSRQRISPAPAKLLRHLMLIIN
ncbi:MAG: hypothetical protein IPN33_07735 [Saprospiraceae bacterium]|nr:hypothetical protein [Saprospiraceae bacterium]